MITLDKLMAFWMSMLMLVGALFAFANRKYLVDPSDDRRLKRARRFGYFMFVGSGLLLLFMWLSIR
jgi:hypothetical protein